MSTSQDEVELAARRGAEANSPSYASTSAIGKALLRPAAPTQTGAADRQGGRLRAFRPDIEGLRAVAVLAVVAYHAAIPGITGGFVGVDIFFVISGFLITSQLLREIRRTGSLSLPRFYARRMRRLLPAAALVTVVTVVFGWLVLDPLQAKSLSTDAVYSAGYAINWHLAAQGTNYLTATQAPSALQHFWSLAVEEQFYFIWPVLLLTVAVVLRKLRLTPAAGPDVTTARGRRVQTGAFVLLTLAIVAASFVACVRLTTSAEPWAYFGLHTRAWELGAGALVALAAPHLSRIRPSVASFMTWAGLAGLVAAILTFTDSTVFPGSAAALPTLSATLVIAGGCAAPRLGAETLLGRSPMQVIGALSYSWYLWHWPLLQLVPAAVGHPLDLRHRLLVAVLALVLAGATYALLEHPVRRLAWPERLPWRGLGVGLTVAAVTASLAFLAIRVGPTPIGSGANQEAVALSANSSAGLDATVARQVTAALDTKAVPANLTPSLTKADTTLPQSQVDGCHASFAATKVRTDCVYGDAAATKTMVLFGDSHALQWFPAINDLAKKDHYRLVSVTKSSCTPFSVTIWNETFKRPYTECDTWRAAAITAIARLHPDMVVVSSLTGVLDHGLDGGGAGFDAAWAKGTSTTVTDLRKSGAKVDVIDDTLNPGQTVPQCLAGHLSNAQACDYYRSGGLYPPARRAAQAKAAKAAGAVDVDPTGWLCTGKRCPTIVGNLLVFRDQQHLSTAYASWLATPLGARLGL